MYFQSTDREVYISQIRIGCCSDITRSRYMKLFLLLYLNWQKQCLQEQGKAWTESWGSQVYRPCLYTYPKSRTSHSYNQVPVWFINWCYLAAQIYPGTQEARMSGFFDYPIIMGSFGVLGNLSLYITAFSRW